MTAPRSPRDVLADRIAQWAGEASVYNYADRLLIDLDANCDLILAAATAACDECRGRHRCQYHEGFADGLGAAVIARVSLPPDERRPMSHAEDLAGKYAYWCGRLETLVAVLAGDHVTDADREVAAATLAEYRRAFPTDTPTAGTGQ